MVWEGPRTPRDPLLNTSARRWLRSYWLGRRVAWCQCGCDPPEPIDYDTTFVVVNGRRRLNPASLVVGHIVSRFEARQLGWTVQQINALGNTRPERADHSLRSGAQLGERVRQGRTPVRVWPPIDTASRWLVVSGRAVR